MSLFKSFIDPQDRHTPGCPLGFHQGVIYKNFGPSMGYRRILLFYYREYLWWQKPLIFFTSPIIITRMARHLVFGGAGYSFPDPTTVFPRGKCYGCGVLYGQGGYYEHPDIERLFHGSGY